MKQQKPKNDVLLANRRIPIAQFFGENFVFGHLNKKQSLAQNPNDRQMLSAFEECELNVDFSSRLSGHHHTRFGARAGVV